MNNKGFTLVELLAVLVILTAIMTIALPSISSSMSRTKKKQDEKKIELLKSYAELYVTDHKNRAFNNSPCVITFDMLDQYLPENATKDSNNKEINGYILFTKPNTFEYKTGTIPSNKCNN